MRKVILGLKVFFTVCIFFAGTNFINAATYYSTGNVAPNTLSNWKTNRDGTGSSPLDFTSGDEFVIQGTGGGSGAPHTMTTSSTWSVSGASSRVCIEDGANLVATSAITLNAATTFQIDNGGTYTHSNAIAFGTTIMQGIESFGNSSTVIFTDWNSTGPNVSSWGNIVYNAPGAVAGSMQFSSNLTTVNGNLEIIATGSTPREVRLATTGSYSLTISGDLIISGGIFNPASGASGGTRTINIGGNVNMTAGTFLQTNTTATTLNFTGTNKTWTQSGGTYTNTNLNWNINSGASLTLANNFPIAASRTLTVNGILDCGSTLTTTGSGSTIISGTGTLRTGNSNGVSTSVGTTTKIFSSGHKIEWNGTVAQSTGLNGLTLNTPTDYTISNTAGTVTADANVTFGNTSSLVVNENATFDASTFTFTFGTTSTATLNGYLITGNVNGFNGAANTTIASTNSPTITLGTNNTIEYNSASAQSLTPFGNYRDLIISGAGTKTATGEINTHVHGDITISGTLANGGFNIRNGGSVLGSGTMTGAGDLEMLVHGKSVSGITLSNLKINTGGNISLSGALLLNGTLTLTDGTLTTNGNLTIADGGTINKVGGSLSQAPTFSGTTDIEYNGTVDLTTGVEMPDVVGELLVNIEVGARGGVITLNKPITATSLTLTRGFILSTSVNLITMSSPITTDIGSNESYVLGPIAQNVSTDAEVTRVYPIGRNRPNGSDGIQATYRPVTITIDQVDATSTTYTIEVIDEVPPNHTVVDLPLRILSSRRYYSITQNPSTTLEGNSELTLSYGIGEWGDGVENGIDLRIAKYSGAIWENIGGTGSADFTGTITSDPITSFSFFALASEDENEPMPIELSSFSSITDRNKVFLNWQTVSEINNSGFDIERKSAEANEWTKVGNVIGSGTVSEPVNYSFTDQNLITGAYNYRLKQIDYNGNFEYFSLSTEVIIGTPEKFTLSQNYPNPFNPTTTINYELPISNYVSLKIFDVSGREVATLVNEVKEAGYHSVSFDARNLSSGMYFYRLTTENFSEVKKMLTIK